jgi:hypothetical protein
MLAMGDRQWITRARPLAIVIALAGCGAELRPAPWSASDDAALGPDATTVDVTAPVDRTTSGDRPDASVVADGSDVADVSDVPEASVVADVSGDAGDAPMGEVSVDSGAVRDVEPDVPAVDPCAGAAVIDLASVGVVSGSSTRALGDNSAAPRRSVLPVPSGCAARDAYPIVYRYTARTGSRVRVTVDGHGSRFNPAVWLLDRCATDAASLGCDDGGSSRGSGFPSFVQVTTAAPIAAGTTLYLVVAGYDGSRGAFDLSVDELEPIAAGEACPRAKDIDLCGAGTSCFAASPTAVTGRCVADGNEGGACRRAAGVAACDGSLTCVFAGSGVRRCVRPIAAGAPCDRSSPTSSCAPGARCTGSSAICEPEGAALAGCRGTSEATACDEGLVCDAIGECGAVIPRGGSCEPFRLLCATGLTCEYLGRSGSRCTVVGSLDAPCEGRAGGAPCAAGLTCSQSAYCRVTVLAGAACDVEQVRDSCPTGSTCIAPGGSSPGRCVAEGARDGQCRAPPTSCDDGLECGSNSTCQPVVPLGGACDAGRRCAAGTTCVGARCVGPGVLGGRCRAGERPCDGDLGCSDAGLCLVGLPRGAVCDASGRTDACGGGMSCQIQEPRRDGALGLCLADGALGGACRVTVTPCDAGLTCSRATSGPNSSPLAYYTPGPRCLPVVADGAACDPGGQRDACEAPSRCVVAGPASWCQASGYREALVGDVVLLDACAGDGVRVPRTTNRTDPRYTEVPVLIPFPFRLFGVPQGRAWPSLSGMVTFGRLTDASSPVPNANLPAAALPGPVPLPGATVVCARTFGVAPARRLVLEWLTPTSPEPGTALLGLLEVVLSEGSETIEFLYAREAAAGTVLLRDAFTNVGLQADRGTAFALHLGGIAAGTGIRFTPR